MVVQVLRRPRARTVEEWLRLPEGPPYYELEEGRLVRMPSPTRQHQRIVGRLFAFLDDWTTVRGLGTVVMEVDVALPTGRGYIPDLTFVRREREAELLTPDGKVRGVPDLVVEVVSPGTQGRDRYTKFRAYWEAGVPWYWLVDSETLVIQEFQYTPEGYLCRATVEAGEVFRPQALPGLELDLAALVGTSGRRSRRHPKNA
jgi:Uma2 family endonuclease